MTIPVPPAPSKRTAEQASIRPTESSAALSAEQQPASVKDGDLVNPMDLREFYEQLGVVMRLPRKPKTVQMPTIAAAPIRRRKRGRLSLLPILAVAMVAAVGWARVKPRPAAVVPAQLTGTWAADDPRYAGRALVITAQSVESVIDNRPLGRFLVTEVKSKQSHDTIVVALRYTDDGAAAELGVSWVGAPSERIMLRNPSGVAWRRVVAGPSLTPVGFAITP